MTQPLRAAEPSTALAEIERIALPATFTPAEVTDVLDKIKAAVAERAPDLDISTAKGRREIASLARRIASTKVALDEHGKTLVADIKARAGLIDEERRRVRTELDALRDQVRAPLDAFEQAESARIQGHEIELMRIAALGRLVPSATVEMIQDRLDQVEALPPRDWREFSERAAKAISIALEDLREQLRRRQETDAQDAELARLQAEEAERKRKEHEAQIAAIAAENARREAEEKARAETEAEARRVEAARQAEADRVERERLAAEEKARQEREAAAAREREIQAAAERAEEQRKQAELDRIEAENRVRIAAERAEEERLRGHRHAMESVRGMIADALSPYNASTLIRHISGMIDAMAELKRDYQEFQADFDKMLADGRERIISHLAAVSQHEAERAENARLEEAARQEQARIATAAQAKRDHDAAIEAERARVAKIAADEETARQRRELDKAHRAKINAAARDAIVKIISIQVAVGAENDAALATEIVKAIARGEVPHTTISY